GVAGNRYIYRDGLRPDGRTDLYFLSLFRTNHFAQASLSILFERNGSHRFSAHLPTVCRMHRGNYLRTYQPKTQLFRTEKHDCLFPLVAGFEENSDGCPANNLLRIAFFLHRVSPTNRLSPK